MAHVTGSHCDLEAAMRALLPLPIISPSCSRFRVFWNPRRHALGLRFIIKIT